MGKDCDSCRWDTKVCFNRAEAPCPECALGNTRWQSRRNNFPEPLPDPEPCISTFQEVASENRNKINEIIKYLESK